MAKTLRENHHHQHQQHHLRHLRHHLLTCSNAFFLCGVVLALLGDLASGNGNVNAAGSQNYTTTELRPKREMPTSETEVQPLPSLPPHGGFGDPKAPAVKQIFASSQSNDLGRNYENPFKELNIFKRAPNGFIGMRGKKEYGDLDDYNPNTLEDFSIDPLYRGGGAATASSNDNSDYDDGTWDWNGRFKKAPTAFYGVRGKKFPNHIGDNYNRLSEMVQQIEEERVRERMLQDFIGRLAEATAAENEINKRAPTGFTGLRGKRLSYNWNAAQLDDDSDDGDGADEAFGKRAPVNAFVGVRGKKEMDSDLRQHQNLFKRSPSESFVGGKRRLSDFNNKFVAVRGKKADSWSSNSGTLSGSSSPVYDEESRRFFVVNPLSSLVYGYGKRAPGGFVGMRGKRDTQKVRPATTSIENPSNAAAVA